MSKFDVETATVADHAERLRSIAPELGTLGQTLGARGDAAAATPTAGTVSGLVEHFSSGLGGFGAAADALRQTMHAAAAEYERADGAVERSAR